LGRKRRKTRFSTQISNKKKRGLSKTRTSIYGTAENRVCVGGLKVDSPDFTKRGSEKELIFDSRSHFNLFGIGGGGRNSKVGYPSWGLFCRESGGLGLLQGRNEPLDHWIKRDGSRREGEFVWFTKKEAQREGPRRRAETCDRLRGRERQKKYTTKRKKKWS